MEDSSDIEAPLAGVAGDPPAVVITGLPAARWSFRRSWSRLAVALSSALAIAATLRLAPSVLPKSASPGEATGLAAQAIGASTNPSIGTTLSTDTTTSTGFAASTQPGNGTARVVAYDESLAAALAGLVKLSECGSLPGIYSSAALGCGESQTANSTSRCERAGLKLLPGVVRLVLAENLTEFPDPVLGFLGRYELAMGTRMETGCIAIFRASAGGQDFLTVGGNDTLMEMSGPARANCTGCLVDWRAQRLWLSARNGLYSQLESIGCGLGSSLRFAGRGIGGAVTALAMFESAVLGFDVQPSYIFGARMPGNPIFAAQLAATIGPGSLVHVTYGLDIDPLRPWVAADALYWPVGDEVHYPEAQFARFEVCPAEVPRGSCGSSRYARELLSDAAACDFALAPDASFCDFPKFIEACYLGQGYEEWQGVGAAGAVAAVGTIDAAVAPSSAAAMDVMAAIDGDSRSSAEGPKLTLGPSNPAGSRSAGQVQVKLSLAQVSQVNKLYNERAAKFLAAMNKMTFCGPTAGLESGVMRTCAKHGSQVGVSCVAGTFRRISLEDMGVPDALFSYVVALQGRSGPRQYLLAVRGTYSGSAGDANNKRNMMTSLRPYLNRSCSNAMAHTGYSAIWDKLREPVQQALAAIGARKSSLLTVTGYSLGGAVAQLAMYDLALAGFDVQLTYTFEQPRSANAELVACTRRLLGSQRLVPYFRISNQRDSVPAFPSNEDYASMDFEVHFEANSSTPQICTGQQPCGTAQYLGRNLSMALFHCPNPLAPDGNLCSFGKSQVDYFAACYLGAGI